MLDPQTQHKGTVYGDDESAPKPRDSARLYLLTYSYICRFFRSTARRVFLINLIITYTACIYPSA